MKTVAIVGAHPRTRDLFDFDRQDCDIWVFNEAMSAPWCKRATAVFQMHSPTIWRNPANRNDPNHYAWLQSGKTPKIVMQDYYDDVPASERYPMSGILYHVLDIRTPLEELSPEQRANLGVCFTSTLAYMLAYAIFSEYERIEIYGCELETGTEYTFQRESFSHWAGFARGRGIVVDDKSNILRAPLYGYEGAVAVEYEAFGQRIAEIDPACDEIKAQYDQKHAIVAAEFSRFTQTGLEPERFHAAICDLLEIGKTFSILDGQRQENIRYKDKADKMRETSGEFIFSRQEFESSLQALKTAHDKKITESNIGSGICGAVWADACKANNKIWRQKRMSELAAAFEQNLKDTTDAFWYLGAMQENMMFLRGLDERIKAAGGAKSEAVMLEHLREVA